MGLGEVAGGVGTLVGALVDFVLEFLERAFGFGGFADRGAKCEVFVEVGEFGVDGGEVGVAHLVDRLGDLVLSIDQFLGLIGGGGLAVAVAGGGFGGSGRSVTSTSGPRPRGILWDLWFMLELMFLLFLKSFSMSYGFINYHQ